MSPPAPPSSDPGSRSGTPTIGKSPIDSGDPHQHQHHHHHHQHQHQHHHRHRSDSRGSSPIVPPQTPPLRKQTQRNTGTRARSDSSVSAIIMTPEHQPSTPVSERHSFGRDSRPVTFLDNEQDMADLTAEMALLDEGFDTRTGKSSTARTGTGTGLRPLSLQYKPSRPRSFSSSSSSPPEDRHAGGAGTHSGTRSIGSGGAAPIFYSVGGESTYTPLSAGDTYSQGSLSPEKSSRRGLFGFRNSSRGRGGGYGGRRRGSTLQILGILSAFLYRLRVVLRLLSIMGAGCLLGVLAHVTNVYIRTKGTRDPKTGDDLWPEEGLDLMPTNTLIAGAAICLVAGLGWTIAAGVSKAVRKLDNGCAPWLRWIAGLSAAAETAVWVAVISYTGRVRNESMHGQQQTPTLFWVCTTNIGDESLINYQLHCGEIRAGWFAAISVCSVTFLILLTIMCGSLIRRLQRRQKGKGKVSLEAGFDEK